eukprot:gene3348-5895_t
MTNSYLSEDDLIERLVELDYYQEYLQTDEIMNKNKIENNKKTINYYLSLLQKFKPIEEEEEKEEEKKKPLTLQQLRNLAEQNYLKENSVSSSVSSSSDWTDEEKKKKNFASRSFSTLTKSTSFKNFSKKYLSFQSNDSEVIVYKSPRKNASGNGTASNEDQIIINDDFFIKQEEEEKKSKKIYEIVSKKNGTIKLNTNPFSNMNSKDIGKNLKVVICTWNVGEGYSVSIAPWILKNSIKEREGDIYVIGFQEVDMSLYSIVKSQSKAMKTWDDHFSNHFSPNKFKKIISQQLVGMYHIMYVKNEHFNGLSNFEWTQLGFGKVGLGNKGCISYRFDLYGNSFCFINTHFESGKSKIEERNENFNQIMKEKKFFQNEKLNPVDHDFCYFYGDFNYRLNLSRQDALNLISIGEIDTLLLNDQLNIEKKKKNVFNDFFEDDIKFMPTYKFDKWTNDYDTEI